MKRLVHAMERKSIPALTAIALALTGCGGGGSAGAGNSSVAGAPVQSPVVTVAKLAAGAKTDVVLMSTAGHQITFFGENNASNSNVALKQAVLQTAQGDFVRVYYASDGSISKIVDEKSGAFSTISSRNDKLGADYLFFNASGAFASGYTLYQTGNKWFTAPVLGDLGQLTMTFDGVAPASGTLTPSSLSYGPATEVPVNVAKLLNPGTVVSSLSSTLMRPFPSANAQSFTQQDRANLFSYVAVSIIGSVAAVSGAPVVGTLIAAAAVVQAYRALSGVYSRNLDSIDPSINTILEDNALNDLGQSDSLVERSRSRFGQMLANGIESIKSAVATSVTRTSDIPSNTRLPQAGSLASTTPPQILPIAVGDGTSLRGTFVDNSNRIYSTTGTISVNRTIAAVGLSQDGTKLNVTANLLPGTNAVAGTFTQTNSLGNVFSSGALSSGQAAFVGKCQTTTQSGGRGTFAYSFNVGNSGGNFDVSYEMYGIPDALTILNGQGTLFSTNGLVSGSRSVSLVAPKGDGTVFVNLSAPNSGTAWDFRVGCVP